MILPMHPDSWRSPRSVKADDDSCIIDVRVRV
jgi:hypothetical protein